jgi:RNA polymerase sigma-70 factor, ECF subfamily
MKNSAKGENLSGADSSTDPTAWVDRYGDYLFAYALSRVHKAHVAEEIVQETLLAALQARGSFLGGSTERTWLVGILRHKLFDHFRKAMREEPFSPGDAASTPEESAFETDGEWVGHWRDGEGPIEWHDPFRALEQKEFMEVLLRCIEALPENIAGVFVLRELEGSTSEEICDRMKISANNLWVMLHRARMRLRRCLEMKWFRPQQSL